MSACDCPLRRIHIFHEPASMHWSDCAITPIYSSVVRDVGRDSNPRWGWAIDIFGYWYPGSKELAGLD